MGTALEHDREEECYHPDDCQYVDKNCQPVESPGPVAYGKYPSIKEDKAELNEAQAKSVRQEKTPCDLERPSAVISEKRRCFEPFQLP